MIRLEALAEYEEIAYSSFKDSMIIGLLFVSSMIFAYFFFINSNSFVEGTLITCLVDQIKPISALRTVTAHSGYDIMLCLGYSP